MGPHFTIPFVEREEELRILLEELLKVRLFGSWGIYERLEVGQPRAPDRVAFG
jgi:hypothetical protein